MKRNGTFLAARLALFYGLYFLVMGVLLPFWPVWLKAQGLGSGQIAILVALGPWVRAVANPWVAQSADRRRQCRRLILWLGWGSAASFALFAFRVDYWWLLLVSVIFNTLFSPLLALGETLTLLTTMARGLDYGRIRLWGSLAFIVAAVFGGQLLREWGPDLIVWLLLAMLLVLAGVCHLLPEVPRDRNQAPPRAPIRRMLGHPRFLLLLAVTSAIQASHGLYYGFSALHWKAVGHHEGTIGWLWAEGVIAEIILFACAPAVGRWFGATQLLIIGGSAAVLRWWVTAQTTDLMWLAAVQPLHGLTYGATHLGAMRLIAQHVPASLSATAQSLYAGLANGGAMGACLLLSGVLYRAYGGRGYEGMALLGAVGVAGAVLLHQAVRRAGRGTWFA